MIRILIIFSIVFFLSCSIHPAGEKKYKVVNDGHTYSVINSNDDTILKLDSSKYYVCFDDSVENFLIVAPKTRKGWWAIDFEERFLFQVYNTSDGEPSPDELTFGMIRIVNDSGEIGFANKNGIIVIKPKFEYATKFYKGYSIVGQNCKKVPWDTIIDESDCHHYDIHCTKYGYIDNRGNIIEMTNKTFEELAKDLSFPKMSY